MILDIMAIPLSQGLYALVDGEDYEWLNQWKWSAVKDRNTFYAIREVILKNKRTTIRMHRQIMNIESGKLTDHISHYGLDNRKANLRSVTHNQNRQNIISRCGTSKYKGVSWSKERKKWCASIGHNHRTIKLGYYENELEAAKIYDKKARELFGEFVNTNF